MLTGPTVILILKIAVATVTVLLLASLVCAAWGLYRWHGRINMAFFVLTLVAVLGLEVMIRLVDPNLFDYFSAETRRAMAIHLGFSIPSTVLMPVMLFTGLSHRRRVHMSIGALFLLCWTGTFVTGIFWLPHE